MQRMTIIINIFLAYCTNGPTTVCVCNQNTMGTSSSTSHPKVEVKSFTDPLNDEGNFPTKSGVRITTSNLMNDFEQQVQNAYTRGKEESKADVQKALDLVAAQVYDNMRSQLAEIQSESIEKSQKMVKHIWIFSFVLTCFFLGDGLEE